MIIGMKIKNIISKLTKSQIYLLALLLVVTVLGISAYLYQRAQNIPNRLWQEHLSSLQMAEHDAYLIHKKNYTNTFLQKKYISFNQDGFRPSRYLYIDHDQDLKLGILGNWWTEGFAFSDAETMPFMFAQMSVATHRIGKIAVKGIAEPEAIMNSNTNSKTSSNFKTNNKSVDKTQQHPTLEIKSFSIAGNSWQQQLNLAASVLNTNPLNTMLLILNANEIIKSISVYNLDWMKQSFCVDNQDFEKLNSSIEINSVVDQLENSIKKLMLQAKNNGTQIVILYVPFLSCTDDKGMKDFNLANLRRWNALGLAVCEVSLSDKIRQLILQYGMRSVAQRAVNDFMVVNAYHCISRAGI